MALARAAGVMVSVGQFATFVRAVALLPVEERGALKRLVRLTLGTATKDLPVLDRAVDLLFPPLAQEDSEAGPTIRAEEVRARLAASLARGDLAAMGDIAVTAADLAARRDGIPVSPGQAAQRVLRSLDLASLLAQALGTTDGVESWRGRLAFAEGEERLDEFEKALLAELRRRHLATEGEHADLLGELKARELLNPDSHLPLVGGSLDQRERLQQAIRPLARRLAARARRQRRGGRRHLDMRRTLLRSVSSGGVPVDLRFRRRKPRRPEIVVLADVSGSMAEYAGFTLGLIGALHAELPALRCYAFVDGAGEVLPELLAGKPGLAASLPLVPGVVVGDGHSNYGRALRAFATQTRGVLGPSSTVVVIGDGRARDQDPGLDTLRQLSQAVRAVYWITPEPETAWDTGDCCLQEYRRWCREVTQVADLEQLERWVGRVVLQVG